MKTTAHYADIFQKEIPSIGRWLNNFISKTLNDVPYRGIVVNTQMIHYSASPDTIYYNPPRKLQWNEFKGLPDNNSTATAQTASSIGYLTTSQITDGYLNVYVTLGCFFLPKQSWIKRNSNWRTLITHEQIHFDIGYLWAINFFEAVKKHQFSVNGWQRELKWLSETYVDEMNKMQRDYDDESDNGRNEPKQREWQKRIAVQASKSPL
ncbi:MAG: hypothetical protein QM764_09735 [Chitinophagaceae bacterium]